MIKNYKKNILLIIILFTVLFTESIIFAAEKGTIFNDWSFDLIYNEMDYKYGIKTAQDSTSYYANITLDQNLINEYVDWRNHYVTCTGADSYYEGSILKECLRVTRDLASNYYTVSEGQAYGMLLALYFNDKDTFNKLYNYVRKYSKNTIDPATKRRTGLMH